MTRPSFAAAFAAMCMLLVSCSTTPAPATTGTALDRLAEDYVQLTLGIGELEPGYVDAYYGPEAWAAEAKAHPRTLPALRAATQDLLQRIESIDGNALAPLERRRRAFLAAQLTAARTRLQMLAGEKPGFEDEARGLFGVRLQLQPLSAYDPVLARIEQLLPGPGPLWQRMDAESSRSAIARDRLEPVMRAAIAECRRRTLQHIALPPGERFTLEFVTGKAWSGYNWYQGNATSLIQINTDLPVLMGRAVDLGCHEGYPGHHVLNTLLEQHLYKDRGWIEFTVYPLYSPQSFLAEGSANYGIELAFSDAERLAFESQVLYPLAGLDPKQAARDLDLQRARAGVAGARMTIAREYLDGRIDRATAVALAQKYQLLSPQRAEQSIGFTDKYRSYVINYGSGLDQVRTYVEAAGPGVEQRWAAMERILSEPTIPSDLAVAPPH
ncbi:MAG: hypothetical protein ABIW35_07690 [Luteimonas sp.]